MTDIFDTMKQEFLDRKNLIKDTLVSRIKSEAPKKRTSPVLRDWAVDNLGHQDMQALIQEFGQEAVNRLLFEKYMSSLDKRRR